MSSKGFDAGGDFGSPQDAVSEALAGGASPAPETPAATEQPSVPDVPAAWADGTPESTEAAPVAANPPAAPAKIRVKGNREEREFDLNPESEDLKRTLAMGLGAGKWKQERDEAKQELTRLKAELEATRAKSSSGDQVKALAQRGHYEQAVRKALGDEGFTKFMQGLAQEFDDYTSGDPEKRTAIERNRFERAQRFKDEEAEARVREATERLQALESKIETDRLHSIGSQALRANDFSAYVKDPDQAQALRGKLWRLAWSELEDMAEGGTQVTESVVNRVFADNARVLQAGLTRQVEERVTKVVEQKKSDAKAQAQVAATERYPKGAPDLTGWDGRSSKDLLKRLVGRG